MLYKIENTEPDLSYYPGINHVGDTEVELEEYILSISKLIDATLNRLLPPQSRFKFIKNPWGYGHSGLTGITGSFGVTGSINTGYVYAPYIPMQMIPKKKIFERYKNKIINKNFFGKY